MFVLHKHYLRSKTKAEANHVQISWYRKRTKKLGCQRRFKSCGMLHYFVRGAILQVLNIQCALYVETSNSRRVNSCLGKYEGTMILQNIRNYLCCDTASHHKRLESTILLSEPHSSNVRAILSDDQYNLSRVHEGMWKYVRYFSFRYINKKCPFNTVS